MWRARPSLARVGVSALSIECIVKSGGGEFVAAAQRQLVRAFWLGLFQMNLLALKRCVHGAPRNPLPHVSGQQVAESKVMHAVAGW